MLSQRIVATAGVLGILTVAVAPVVTGGQAPSSASQKSSWTPPSTAWGHPDFQGVWQAMEAARPSAPSAPPLALPPELQGRANRDTGAGPEHWYEAQPLVFLGQLKIVDPKDGKVPPMTAEGKKRASSRPGVMPMRPRGPEEFSSWDRCITRGVPGSMIPINYNNNYQFLQTRDHVVILYEMIHDARVIPLDGKPHVTPGVKLWMGDPRARWEGNTLVVETTNFTDKTRIIYGDGHHSDRLRLTERFIPVDAVTMRYEFTVDDPGTWEKPFTAVLSLARGQKTDRILEYACHEGNYGLANMLSAARAEEKKADAARPGAVPR